MPLYVFNCDSCGLFEKRAGFDDHSLPCAGCGGAANRAPFSGSVAMKVEGRVLITDPVEAQYEQHRANRRSGWDYDRALRRYRSGVRETETGRVYDPKLAVTPGGNVF